MPLKNVKHASQSRAVLLCLPLRREVLYKCFTAYLQ